MTILHYLENTALAFPDKMALTDEFGGFSFSELRNKALSIAACVKEKLQGKTHRPVLVYLPKSKEAIAAFLGIVYSGNMYTPTDVRFPFAKVKGIIDVLAPELYISDCGNAAKLVENGIAPDNIIVYDEISTGENTPSCDFSRAIDTDPVYTLFTSGSTGIPKGVTIPHRGIIDYIDWAQKKFGIDENHILGNQAPFYFDNSILDIYLCLKTGARMHIIPERLFAFPVQLLQHIDNEKVNFIFWVPSALCHIANKDTFNGLKLTHLKKVLFCGEIMPNKQLNYWRSHIPSALYANLYGPTEITDACIYYIIDREFADDEPLPIGFPCENTDILILDEENRLVTKPGVQGEICVRGSSLAHGYWNNPEKTAEAFCQNPLNPHYPEKIYRTGDLARYNERGEIIFDGRKDFQIKHLGYRIELGEIEAAVMSIAGVDRACADYDGEKQEIVMFYSGAAEKNDLWRALSSKLPKYMIPTRYIRLDKLPLNDNGKIDRAQLRKNLKEVCK